MCVRSNILTSRIIAVCSEPSHPKIVAWSGSPLTVARPCRILTGFLDADE
jgi:hypothetical protein